MASTLVLIYYRNKIKFLNLRHRFLVYLTPTILWSMFPSPNIGGVDTATDDNQTSMMTDLDLFCFEPFCSSQAFA